MAKISSDAFLLDYKSFQKIVDRYRKDEPFSPEILNKYNPYNTTHIHSEADYELYIREKAFRDHCISVASAQLSHCKMVTRAFGFLFCLILTIAFFVNILPSKTQEAFTSGYDTGYDIAYSKGRDEGRKAGYDEGYEEGFHVGITGGYELGYSDAINKN